MVKVKNCRGCLAGQGKGKDDEGVVVSALAIDCDRVQLFQENEFQKPVFTVSRRQELPV